jgi:hypothetical protein
MAAQVSITLTETGTNMPENTTSAGPVTDTVTNAVISAGQTQLATTYTAIAVPTGATQLELFQSSGASINITLAAVNTDTGLNMGTLWTWAKVPVLGGTVSNIYLKAASGTPTVTWKFR